MAQGSLRLFDHSLPQLRRRRAGRRVFQLPEEWRSARRRRRAVPSAGVDRRGGSSGCARRAEFPNSGDAYERQSVCEIHTFPSGSGCEAGTRAAFSGEGFRTELHPVARGAVLLFHDRRHGCILEVPCWLLINCRTAAGIVSPCNPPLFMLISQ